MIEPTDTIVTAFADRCSGPGWSNSPVLVVVRDEKQKLRMEYLQPREQSGEIAALYDTSQAAHRAMVRAVERMWRR